MGFTRLVSIAPMMDWTDCHDRYFLRLISPHVLLYTEMITANALIHGDYKKLLKFDKREHPVALQLGGSCPQDLARAAQLGEAFGYDEINLNVGCPSSRVKQGRFGACLMLQPELVAECVAALSAAVALPVTVKCRIGVDDADSYAELCHFVKCVSAAGCQVFIIHARKAWLHGLSPKQNRDIPPLRYDIVQQIKQDFPHLSVVLNGGIKTIDVVQEQLQFFDGVMIGREAYSNPYFLAEIERIVFSGVVKERETIAEEFIAYIEEQLKLGTRLSAMTRHILGLFQGQPGARTWRRTLSERVHYKDAGAEIVRMALNSKEEIVCIND